MNISRLHYCAVSGLIIVALAVVQDAGAANLSQQQLSDIARHTTLKFGVINNFAAKPLAHIIVSTGTSALPAGPGDWRIYFHSIRKLDSVQEHGLRLRHLQGDLHELSPTPAFKGLAANATMDFRYTCGSFLVSYTDFMPRAFIAQPGLVAAVFANTDTENLMEFVEPFSKPEQQLRASNDDYPIATAATRYRENLAVNTAALKVDAGPKIIPTPAQVEYRKESVVLDSSWHIQFAGRLAVEAHYFASQLNVYGLRLKSIAEDAPVLSKTIQVKVDNTIANEEAYRLTISADKMVIVGGGNAGAFYGIQSLLSLLPAQMASSYPIPQLKVVDSPRYPWRGMHYDMSRNFHGKEYTLRLIEQMARYKLNKLHLHLTDDEGWRIQIPGLPELTEIGAHRCFDLSEQSCLLTQLGTGPHKSGSGNGFYSVADFIDILKYASARHIEVVPEIDMPGHARAAVKSMEARYHKLFNAGKKAQAEQYLLSDPLDQSRYISVQSYTDNSINVCLQSTYAFADKVIYELQQMYRSAGTKLRTFHMGGDEVGAGAWAGSPACDALIARGEPGVAGVADLKPYFVGRISALTARRGLALAGWEDGLMYDPYTPFNRAQLANQHVLANTWDNIWEWGVADRPYRLANAGYEPILSPATHLYFDHPQEAHAQERGYYWAARYTDTAKVFGFMPDNLYANADKTLMGTPIKNLEALVGRALPELEKPENLRGLQGQVWSETIRTGQQLEEMIFPRLIPLAERAWHRASWEGDMPNLDERAAAWAAFAVQIAIKELPKLALYGVGFYLPPPGAIVDDGELKANSSMPGLTLEYSVDQGVSWRTYTGNHKVQASDTLVRIRLGAFRSRSITATK